MSFFVIVEYVSVLKRISPEGFLKLGLLQQVERQKAKTSWIGISEL